jgi:uncharacterized protein (DUF983 family)
MGLGKLVIFGIGLVATFAITVGTGIAIDWIFWQRLHLWHPLVIIFAVLGMAIALGSSAVCMNFLSKTFGWGELPPPGMGAR